MTGWLAIFAAGAAAAALVPQNQVNFVSCPQVRDVDPPCWLAEHEGQLYFLGVQQDLGYDFNPPQLKHRVLVEGTISAEAKKCGGLVLKPVFVSVIEELDPSCDTILPADGFSPPPSVRRASPRPHALQLATDPNDWNREPEYTPPPLPKPPYPERRYDLYFTFDSTFMFSKTSKIFLQAFTYANAIKAKEVEIRGYRSASLLSNGERLKERSNVAQLRAHKIAADLSALGLPESSLNVSWRNELESSDGITDPLKRRVTIVIRP